MREGPQARSEPRKPPAPCWGRRVRTHFSGHHRLVYRSVTRTAPRFPSKRHPRPRKTAPVAGTHPLRGRDPKAVLLHAEAAGRAHLGEEVQVPSVLRLAALRPLELPHEVKAAAG